MKTKKILTFSGNTAPLGISLENQDVNFALFAPDPSSISLGIFSPDQTSPNELIPLQKKGDIWCVKVRNIPKDAFYGFLIEKKWVLDPFAKQLNASPTWGEQKVPLLGKVFPEVEFDWEGDLPLHLPFESLSIYEMHVRGFTQDKTSKVKHPGTFLGVIEKISYLQQLGINAIELLPIFDFDETLNTHINPKNGKKLHNYWGYSTRNYFSPMASYGTIQDFKEMVKTLHKAGIEVFLDVVYNHVGTQDFAILAKDVYFILDKDKQHTNYTGCGNTISCNHPIVIQFILSSLCYWVEEMHVDGFRFDLASIFCRNPQGKVLKKPPILKAIETCKALKHTKLIAEAWDAAGLYQVGSFPSKRFAEWNDSFRDTTRLFLKGTDEKSSDFASVILGSPDLYQEEKKPYQSINFITSHDGFTMWDLVSYNDKHNEENGEENRDGNNNNHSWNCGVEGPTNDPNILTLRERRMRSFLFVLCTSIGTPMFLMGDEYGRTQNGNNNTYCQDNPSNYFLWDFLENNSSKRLEFFQYLLAFRKSMPQFFERKTFLLEQSISWHGHFPYTPKWHNRFVAYVLEGKNTQIYIAFNAHFENATIIPPKGSKHWKRVIDTALCKQEMVPIHSEYLLPSYSSLLLLS